eukprot:1693023-Rhodomonas_salina.1
MSRSAVALAGRLLQQQQQQQQQPALSLVRFLDAVSQQERRGELGRQPRSDVRGRARGCFHSVVAQADMGAVCLRALLTGVGGGCSERSRRCRRIGDSTTSSSARSSPRATGMGKAAFDSLASSRLAGGLDALQRTGRDSEACQRPGACGGLGESERSHCQGHASLSAAAASDSAPPQSLTAP